MPPLKVKAVTAILIVVFVISASNKEKYRDFFLFSQGLNQLYYHDKVLLHNNCGPNCKTLFGVTSVVAQ